jgi:hypothetical protein
VSRIKDCLAPGAVIYLDGCQQASGQDRQVACQQLANLLGCTIYASPYELGDPRLRDYEKGLRYYKTGEDDPFYDDKQLNRSTELPRWIKSLHNHHQNNKDIYCHD